uniref:SPRY domain-containing protein n=1 Tax=Meloidogyne incognita TaxID=6306 RepID=A0A914M4I1_MELIC
MGELTNKLERLSKNCKRARFVQIKNKWSEINDYCCVNKCLNEINTNNIKCIKGNGFVKLIDDENCKYINCLEGKEKNFNVYVYAENSFNKPKHCFNYSLYYFEIECNFEGELNNDEKYMSIGLKNSSTHKSIRFSAKNDSVFNEKNESFKLDNTSWNSNDIFGCGLVYPPTNKLDEYPYLFFIQNGKQIGCIAKGQFQFIQAICSTGMLLN